LSLFLLPTAEQIKQFAKSLAWLYIISGIGFVLLPGAQPNPPARIDGWTRPVFEFADWINLDHNLCPSLHVGMAVLGAYAYSRLSHPLASTLIWLWATAIAASTLLLRQHYLVDVAAGAALGYLVAKHVFHSSLGSSLPSQTAPSTPPEAASADLTTIEPIDLETFRAISGTKSATSTSTVSSSSSTTPAKVARCVGSTPA
jgi:hypothetical protein